MAEIIDIRERLGRIIPQRNTQERERSAFSLRLCGPDLRWLDLVGGILTGALAAEGFRTVFADMETDCGSPPMISMQAGLRTTPPTELGKTPSLVVAGTSVPERLLHGCDTRSVLLAYGGDRSAGGVADRGAFPGTEVKLPLADPAPEPLGIAAACAGGAARLLGVIRWRALVQALREELTLSDARLVVPHVAAAFEAYRQLAGWKGIVFGVQDS